MDDVLILGGGAIGLSLAWDLAKHGLQVTVVDRSQFGQESSWAGAGIIPDARQHPDDHPYEQLRGLACRLQPLWAQELLATTGIDNGYRRCGALHLARKAGDAASLSAWTRLEQEHGIEIEKLSNAKLAELEPELQVNDCQAAYLVRGESQLRNPRYVKALIAACRLSGVNLVPEVEITNFITGAAGLVEVQTTVGSLQARQYCFCAGSWTGQLVARLGITCDILPIRGQIVLYRAKQPLLRAIVNEGSRYLVPRADGHVLVGSTEEEAGFDKRTTTAAIADLQDFATALVPALREAAIERTWAGLRPCSFDGFPYLGSLPGHANTFIAAGHFRSGIYLSAATAVVMSQLIRGTPTEIDLAPFRVRR